MRRFINNFDELTSRMRSAEIPAVLQKLFTAKPSREVVDLCYATNMIQVGLDVPRLSIMSIVSQQGRRASGFQPCRPQEGKPGSSSRTSIRSSPEIVRTSSFRAFMRTPTGMSSQPV
jgi:hypothetical protein